MRGEAYLRRLSVIHHVLVCLSIAPYHMDTIKVVWLQFFWNAEKAQSVEEIPLDTSCCSDSLFDLPQCVGTS